VPKSPPADEQERAEMELRLARVERTVAALRDAYIAETRGQDDERGPRKDAE
jgi:hypothetical protein